jgi:hypothetical protein
MLCTDGESCQVLKIASARGDDKGDQRCPGRARGALINHLVDGASRRLGRGGGVLVGETGQPFGEVADGGAQPIGNILAGLHDGGGGAGEVEHRTGEQGDLRGLPLERLHNRAGSPLAGSCPYHLASGVAGLGDAGELLVEVLALGQGPARVEGCAAVLVDDPFQVGECAGQRRRRGVDGLAEQGDGIGREQQDADHQSDAAADQRVEEPLDARGFASPGGATLDNEENYLLKKLFTALGAIQIENRARI